MNCFVLIQFVKMTFLINLSNENKMNLNKIIPNENYCNPLFVLAVK